MTRSIVFCGVMAPVRLQASILHSLSNSHLAGVGKSVIACVKM